MQMGPSKLEPKDWKWCQLSMRLSALDEDTYMPHIETMIVAIFNDRTKGARLMAPAKMT